MILVNEAREQRFKESGGFISVLGISTKDIMNMDESERARRLLDRNVCEKVVRGNLGFGHIVPGLRRLLMVVFCVESSGLR
jgi:hypothetical protein